MRPLTPVLPRARDPDGPLLRGPDPGHLRPSTQPEPGWPGAAARRTSFHTTHWSAVMAAADGEQSQPAAALETLCATYWFPLYAYARRRGHPTEDAQDLTQAFFERLLEKGTLRSVDASRGRFRSFLLTAFNRFAIDRHGQARAHKRGGGIALRSLDEKDPEGRFLAEPADAVTPEIAYARNWATALLERVVTLLDAEFSHRGKASFLEELKPFLWGERSATPYREIALRFGLSEGAIKVTVCRLRGRFRELLRREIALTVSSPNDVEDEIRHLMSTFRS